MSNLAERFLNIFRKEELEDDDEQQERKRNFDDNNDSYNDFDLNDFSADDYDSDDRSTYSSYSSGSRKTNYSSQSSNRQRSDNKVVDISATTRLKVIITRPNEFSPELAKEIAAEIVAFKTVVLNLESENISKEDGRRFLDIFIGITYATGGKITKISKRTYLITPKNVDITGETLLNQLENNGMYFN